MKQERSWRRWGVRIAAACFVILLAAFLVCRISLHVQLEAAITRLEAEQGGAGEEEDTGESEDDLYFRAAECVVNAEGELFEVVPIMGLGDLPAPGTPIPVEMREAIEQCLAANQEALRLFTEAAEQGRAEDAASVAGRKINILDFRRLLNLAHLSAVYCAERGDTQGAARMIQALFAFADFADGTHVREAWWLAACAAGDTVRVAEDVLSRVRFDGPALRSLAAKAPRLQPNAPRMARTIRHECSEVLDQEEWYRAIAQGCRFGAVAASAAEDGGPDLSPLVSHWVRTHVLDTAGDLFWKWSGIETYDRLICARLGDRAPALVDAGFPECLGSLYLLKEWASKQPLGEYAMFATLCSIWYRIATSEVIHSVHWRLVRTAMAVELCLAETGALPATLDELVPDYLDEVPLDLFDGKPIRYLPEEQGYTLYSIGKDYEDDGGRPNDWRQGFEGDLLLTVSFAGRSAG